MICFAIWQNYKLIDVVAISDSYNVEALPVFDQTSLIMFVVLNDRALYSNYCFGLINIAFSRYVFWTFE